MIINTKDSEPLIRLYEKTASGKYYLLSHFPGRASLLQKRMKRMLLQPGKEQSLRIANTFYSCPASATGGTIVTAIGANKNPYWQVNYGTGKDVSKETIADGNVPLRI